jgi:hypothetical protein
VINLDDYGYAMMMVIPLGSSVIQGDQTRGVGASGVRCVPSAIAPLHDFNQDFQCAHSHSVIGMIAQGPHLPPLIGREPGSPGFVVAKQQTPQCVSKTGR